MTGAVLVTGAAGFVGRKLLPALIAGGCEVIALLRGPADDLPEGVRHRVAGPIEDLDAAAWRDALAGVDSIVHLAGIAHVGPDVPPRRYDAVNAGATLAMAEAARRAGVRRIVFMSSIRAQAGASAADVQTEASPARPTEAYGASKLAAERGLAGCGVPHVVLRPVLIVGDEPRGNLRLLLKLAATGWPLPFAALSGGRSLVGIDDVVAAILRALDDPAMAGGTYILAHPEAASVGAMIAALRRGLGLPARLFAVPGWMLAAPLRLAGRGEAWERIGGGLVARPEALTRLWFSFRQPPLEALEALARRRGPG